MTNKCKQSWETGEFKGKDSESATRARMVQCHTCKGTGMIEKIVGGGQSEVSLLRRELIKAWSIVDSYEAAVKSIYEMSSTAITKLVASQDKKDIEIARLNKLVMTMKKELSSYKDGSQKDEADGNATEPTQQSMSTNRKEFREESVIYEAEKNDTTPNPADMKKKTGGQLNHKGCSRKGPVDGTKRFISEMCGTCGCTDLKITFDHKRVFDLIGILGELVSWMYIIGKGTCTVCGDVTVPHTDSIPGTSLGPILRGIIQEAP